MDFRKLMAIMENAQSRSMDEISDDELEGVIDGSTDLDMVREIAEECMTAGGYVDVHDFADLFRYRIQGFIDAEEGSPEWKEADSNNDEWGEQIARGINELLTGESEDDIEPPDEWAERSADADAEAYGKQAASSEPDLSLGWPPRR